MSDSLLNIKGVSCAAVNADIKNNGSLDLSVISRVAKLQLFLLKIFFVQRQF